MSNPGTKTCPVVEQTGNHELNYDTNLSTAYKSVFSCVCGYFEDENEDAGTGA